MDATSAEHPSPEQLAAFASSRLAEDAAARVRSHLAGCEDCRAAVDRPHEAATVAHAGPVALPVEAPPELADHPRYRVLGLLGAGGMGAVYKAEHRLMERLVALKIISPGLMGKPAAVERFRREVKAAAQLAHPNIVTAYDADQAGDAHFLVMEFVEGVSLNQKVEAQGRLPVAEACEYARQAALGLQHAFERGMVHRDVKPHNLMLTPGGQVKILDFGLARFLREAAAADASGADAAPALDAGARDAAPAPVLTQAGQLMGTADFIAPEQANDARQADIRADIYSLGCTLYYLLAGRPPFAGGTLLDKVTAHVERTPPPLTRLRSDVPPELARVVGRMTAKDPAQRYQTPAQVAEALAPFTRPARRRRRFQLLIVAALLAGAALLAALAIYRWAAGRGLTDEERIQGTWQAVRGERDGGTPLTDDELSRTRVIFDGETASAEMPHGGGTGRFSLDAGKNPKRITFIGDQSEGFRGMQGVYSLEGDTLRVCMGGPGDSPTEFRSKAGTGIMVIVFRREQAATAPQRDADKIQGVWRAVSYEEDGTPTPPFVFTEKVRLTMTFEGDQVTTRTEYLDPNVKAERPNLAASSEIQGVFSLNAGTNPKRLSWFRPGAKNTALGVYDLDGDTLRICYYMDPDRLEYPTEARSTPGSGTKLLVLKRQPAGQAP